MIREEVYDRRKPLLSGTGFHVEHNNGVMCFEKKVRRCMASAVGGSQGATGTRGDGYRSVTKGGGLVASLTINAPRLDR
jgi:hypothetical protein